MTGRAAVATGLVFVALVGAAGLRGDDGAGGPAASATGTEVPRALAPFEYLVGGWKGVGVPAANRIRGWPETHAWAWAFEKGVPVGLTVTLQGDKLLARARLTHDAAKTRYTLAGTTPEGAAVTFAGALDASGRQLVLDRAGATPSGAKQRLTLFPNANFVRYTLRLSEQEPGSPQFKPAVEVGLTKEGEAFAAGAGGADLPKCIVTGGAATMTVSYQGQSYPLCCSGCRDEFNENPEKYLKKAALRAAAAAKSTPKDKAAPAVRKDDGAFDGLGDEPAQPAAKAMPKGKGADAEAGSGSGSGSDAARPGAPAAKGSDPAARAASLLRLGQNLEKAGKAAAALGYYRQVVKDFPDTPAARTAAGRVRALSNR